MPGCGKCSRSRWRPREQLVELVWAHLDFCQEHKPLARLFFALFFGPDDQKNLVTCANTPTSDTSY